MPDKTVLIVEDEENLAEALRYNLEREGYNVLTARDGDSGVSTSRRAKPDLVLLDVMLPKLDGFEVCRILRRETSTPIIMLTARGEEVDRIVGLELGADDYVTKPFSMRELLVRIRNILRRSGPTEAPERLRAGSLDVNLNSYTATLEGRQLELKPKEFGLLALLMGNRGRALTRDQILKRLWGYDFVGDGRTVDVHVRWLREKIEAEPSKPKLIATVRGIGYRFDG
ncbi:MAG: response regulator transcription factor [Chloroflexi bacterium]|nr:response regulator transcription factor [Chloroflexota bacterium]